jgi:pyridinium-3,5-bisthiocarboxylic acid mononucleotide nickel chelatase
MKILYIDPSNSGISGDMLLASLLGLLEDPEAIIEELIEIQNYIKGVSKLKIELKKTFRHEIKVNHLKIDIIEEKSHRSVQNLKDSLNAFIQDKGFSQRAKEYANRVFQALVKAEAKVHDTLEEKVHLHELSSVDTLIDIIGVTKCLEKIGIFDSTFRIFCNIIPLGGGSIKGAHGLLPIPAPATIEILKNSKLRVKNGPIEEELVTPTGAALVANLDCLPENKEFSIEKIVSSTGNKEFKDFLNILRIYIGTDQKSEDNLEKYIEEITVLETDVDDVSGEVLGHFITKMKKKQILDIQIIPSLTKKNRPSHLIKILCQPEEKFKIIELMIKDLGTLGVRFTTINRVCVERTIETLQLSIMEEKVAVNYKISYIQEEEGKYIINIKPEYDDLKKISKKLNLPLSKIQMYAQSEIKQLYNKFKSF